ncbi:GTPase HflX [Trichlorobacter lovleyi]|uniref:GTPase HflX n=1 Tax=Trichlorobacter lovleyi (strain ATCC BAA-1151 / DSM 17278 / SZ) TaxID=398767 RepID=B3E8E4_TRIL1|nr:GTP-binding proten HflX [Trichlorobacter lovleyi SZ]
MHELHGNLAGLKQSQIQAAERLYRRRIPADELCSAELAGRLLELSLELRRQIGLLVNRQGAIELILIGTEKGLLIPDLKEYPLGRKRLRGLRLIHTHLKSEPLTEDDLTDLKLLRLDLIAALCPLDGRRSIVHLAHLSTEPGGISVLPPQLLEKAVDYGNDFISTLERSLDRAIQTEAPAQDGQERAILISVRAGGERREVDDSLAELQELARTAGVQVLDSFIQLPRKLNPRTLMGEGKLQEVVIRALQRGATLLIFDQELTPAQVRAISTMTELKVIDRSQLILDIFAGRAKSRDGKVQVELAQLKYLLPRLTGRGVQMSRLMGGIGGRGPGETKLEIDRRRIRDRITALERELQELSRDREQRRSRRVRSGVPIISIVGYTNAGKSTLLNALTQSEIFTENLLFATLDTSSRRLRLPREREVIITDTVGFIRSLPASLMGAFKATLEELQDADLLLHLVDASNPRFEAQIAQVRTILAELGLAEKPELVVFNKTDQLEGLKRKDTIAFLRIAQAKRRHNAISISAVDRKSLAPLLDELKRRFWPDADDSFQTPTDIL